MNRVEYMRELEALLYDIPAEEREDAINYYNDYFDAGGEENEANTIASLGTPEELARTIKLANSDAAVIDGEFTETGYYDGINYDRQEIDKYAKAACYNESEKKNRKKMSAGMIALLIILGIFALPVLGPVLIAVGCVLFAFSVAIVAVIFAIIVAIVAVGVAGLCFGGLGIITGIAGLIAEPLGAMTVLGASLVALAFGLLLVLGCIWLVKVTVPPVCRFAVMVLSKPFKWLIKKVDGIRSKKEPADYSESTDIAGVIETAADQIAGEENGEE